MRSLADGRVAPDLRLVEPRNHLDSETMICSRTFGSKHRLVRRHEDHVRASLLGKSWKWTTHDVRVLIVSYI
jgi:hypothetical protein